MSDLSFKVAARRKDPVTFDLEGDKHVYSFTPPKQARVFMPLLAAGDDGDIASSKAVFEWLDDGLSEEDREHLEARLRDPEDDLDFDTLGEIVKGLMEKVSGRPTT
jgi:hypothetical protein